MDDEARFRKFISEVFWKFAKTYAEKAPHEYVVKGNLDAIHQKEFEWCVLHIRAKGTPEKFWKKTFVYLAVDGYKYWTMGAPLDITIIINRAKA